MVFHLRAERDVLVNELGSAVALLLVIADHCNIDLPAAVQLKIKLNEKKYPAALVQWVPTILELARQVNLQISDCIRR